MTLTSGFCVPASCSPDEVENYLNEQFLNKNYLEALTAYCKTNDRPEFNAIDIAM